MDPRQFVGEASAALVTTVFRGKEGRASCKQRPLEVVD